MKTCPERKTEGSESKERFTRSWFGVQFGELCVIPTECGTTAWLVKLAWNVVAGSVMVSFSSLQDVFLWFCRNLTTTTASPSQYLEKAFPLQIGWGKRILSMVTRHAGFEFFLRYAWIRRMRGRNRILLTSRRKAAPNTSYLGSLLAMIIWKTPTHAPRLPSHHSCGPSNLSRMSNALAA